LGVSLSPFCFAKVIKGISDGSLETLGIVTHKFKLSQFKEAFDMCSRGDRSIKVAFVPD
jgi:threonine dehydrogenase-like Zn-dependent dehydrogenase